MLYLIGLFNRFMALFCPFSNILCEIYSGKGKSDGDVPTCRCDSATQIRHQLKVRRKIRKKVNKMFGFVNFRLIKGVALLASSVFGFTNPELLQEILVGLATLLGIAEVGQDQKEKKANVLQSR